MRAFLLTLLPLSALAGFRMEGYNSGEPGSGPCESHTLSWNDANWTGLQNPHESVEDVACLDFYEDGIPVSMKIDATACSSSSSELIWMTTYDSHGCGNDLDATFNFTDGQCRKQETDPWTCFFIQNNQLLYGRCWNIFSVRLSCWPPPSPRPTPAPSLAPTTIDEAAFWACTQSNCPCATGFQWPGDFGPNATVDITHVRTNAFIAAAVNCFCARCGHYDSLKAWPAYAAGGCGIAQTVVADGSAASQVVLSYYPIDDSTCVATRTMAKDVPDGVCVDPQIAGLAGVKFSCSADGTTYDYEVYGADPNCQGAGDAGVNYSPTLTYNGGSVFALPTPGCYLTADPTAPGQYNSVECFGPDYNSDMTCGAPANTVDAGQTSSSRSRALVAVVVAVAVAVCVGAGAAAAVTVRTVLRLRASSEATVTPAAQP